MHNVAARVRAQGNSSKQNKNGEQSGWSGFQARLDFVPLNHGRMVARNVEQCGWSGSQAWLDFVPLNHDGTVARNCERCS